MALNKRGIFFLSKLAGVRCAFVFSFACVFTLCLLPPFSIALNADPASVSDPNANAPPLRLSLFPDYRSLNPFMQYAVDPAGSFTIDDVAATERRELRTGNIKWIRGAVDNNLSFGFTEAVYWIRIEVQNDTPVAVAWFLQQSYMLVDSVTLYEPGTGGGWKETRTGDRIAYVSRPVPHRTLLFPMNTPAGFAGTYYLRFQSSGSMNIVLTAADPESFRRVDERAAVFVWMFFGLILAVLLYNLFIFVALRSPSHGYFVSHTFFLLIFVSSLSGVANQYFWPESGWVANLATPMSLGLLAASLFQFGRSFLQLRSISLFWDRIFLGFLIASLMGVLSSVLLDYRSSIVIISAVNNTGIIVCLVIGVPYLAIWKESREARVAIVSMLVFLFGATLNFLQTFGFMASSALTEFSYAIGWVLGSIITSFGLADQINILRRQLSGLNAALEKKVRLRTADLNQARIQAENANRSKSDFLANMSHEIRTPMNAILGMAEMIGDPKTPARVEEQQKYLGVLRGAGETLLGLIDDILDLSKIEAGRVELKFSTVGVHELVEAVVDMFRVRAKEKNLELILRFAPDVPAAIRSDPARLRQVLVNLIGNAIKFTESGRIEVDVRQVAGRVELNVVDTGPGIAPDQQTLIFEAFVQADSSTTRRFGGTGLGLAISRQLTELLGGRLELESELDQGSRFYFSLPVAQSAESKTLPLSSVQAKGSGTASSQNRRLTSSAPAEVAVDYSRTLQILLVEDNPDNRILIEAFLKTTNWRLHTSVNGAEGVARFREDSYDLVLMDMQMPIMDGYEATRQIREMEKTRSAHRVPIVALTAHAMKEAVAESLAVGCDGHLTKPIRKSDLLSAILKYTSAV